MGKKGKSEAVRVNVRFRPLQDWERAAMAERGEGYMKAEPFRCQNNSVLDLLGHRKPFVYDSVMPVGSAQQFVYDTVAKSYVQELMDGYDVTIFAYGQTGSGKTYTMMGPPEDPGVTMRMIEDVFAAKANYGREREREDPGAANRKITFQAAFYEIYNGQPARLPRLSSATEAINDLIEPQNRNLRVRFRDQTPFVEG